MMAMPQANWSGAVTQKKISIKNIAMNKTERAKAASTRVRTFRPVETSGDERRLATDSAFALDPRRATAIVSTRAHAKSARE